MEKVEQLFVVPPSVENVRSSSRRDAKHYSTWRLKEHLDESYLEQNSNTNNMQVPISSLLSQDSTSILQSYIHPKRQSSHLLEGMLYSKVQPIFHRPRANQQQPQVNKERRQSVDQVWTTRRHSSRLSSQKQSLRKMRSERMRLLREVQSQLNNQAIENIKYSSKGCPQCNCQQIRQKQTEINTAFTPKKPSFIIKPIMVESMEDIESSQATVVTQETCKKSKMMSKILGFKDHLKKARHDSENAEEDQWYYLPKQLLPTEANSQGGIRVNSQVRSNSLEQSPPEEIAKMFQCLISQRSGQFVGVEDRTQATFTFGQLERNKMKEQLELMKRHMKKVSIDVEEKENQDNTTWKGNS